MPSRIPRIRLSGSAWRVVVELSPLDENKIDRIISHRQSATKPAPNNSIIDHNTVLVNQAKSFISADGEIVIKQLRQPQRRDFSETDIAAIIASYKEGMKTSDIAAEYGCHRKTISGILKKHGVEVSKKKIKSEEEEDRILVLYARNHTIEEIANQYGVGVTVINRLLHRRGVEVRSRWDYSN